MRTSLYAMFYAMSEVVLSRNRPKMLRSLPKMGSKCNILFSEPQKAHSCAKRRLLTYWWEFPSQIVSRNKILHRGRYPGRNHPRKFWSQSVQTFSGGGGRISGFLMH